MKNRIAIMHNLYKFGGMNSTVLFKTLTGKNFTDWGHFNRKTSNNVGTFQKKYISNNITEKAE